MGRRLQPGCKAPNCPELAMKGYGRCEDHQKEFWRNDSSVKRKTGEYNTFYKKTPWRNLRQLQLTDEPLCRECKQPATMVDHIIPIKQGGELLDQKNLQSMCDSCHARKRAQESRQRRVA